MSLLHYLFVLILRYVSTYLRLLEVFKIVFRLIFAVYILYCVRAYYTKIFFNMQVK